jgi:hypothetical protein
VRTLFTAFGLLGMLAALTFAGENPPPPKGKAPPPPKSIVVQLIVTETSDIWMDGKRITLEDVNKLKPGAYTVDDVRGSQGVLSYLGLYSVKAAEPPKKTEVPPPEEQEEQRVPKKGK